MQTTDPELEALLRLNGGLAGKRVLEVGCGYGRLTRKFAPYAAHVDAIDPNETRIAQANGRSALAHVYYHPTALESFAATTPYDVLILSWSL